MIFFAKCTIMDSELIFQQNCEQILIYLILQILILTDFLARPLLLEFNFIFKNSLPPLVNYQTSTKNFKNLEKNALFDLNYPTVQ